MSWKPALWITALYAAMSVITFIAYAMDKSAAKQGKWRTPERSLHLLALTGGWPGAWCAQKLLRHKSSKAAFQSVFWATVVLNVIGLIFLVALLSRLLLKI